MNKTKMDSISFKPQILERIIPDVSLDRHLKVGIRVNNRHFDEFRPIQVLSSKNPDFVTTSSYVQNGNTMIICNITYGINELTNDFDQYTSVYPTVSISRGRSGAPTDEEMNLSQQLYELVLTNKLLPVNNLRFKPKILVDGELQDFPENHKWFKFNLFVNLKVFDRSGPLLSSCYYSLINCLKQVQLPIIYLDDTFGNMGATNNTFSKLTTENLKIYQQTYPLELNLPDSKVPIASNFGIHQTDNENVIICDLENESEEVNILSKANVITSGSDSKKSMSYFNLVNGNLLDVSKDELKQIISHSHARAANLNSN